MNGLPMKVLIIDDQAGVRQLLNAVVSEEGHTVYTGKNGYEAIELVEKYCPDLIFMDIRMPGMDGMEALEKILQMNVDVEIVMMTAFAEKEVLDKNATDSVTYMIKPFDIGLIREKLNQRMQVVEKKKVSVS